MKSRENLSQPSLDSPMATGRTINFRASATGVDVGTNPEILVGLVTEPSALDGSPESQATLRLETIDSDLVSAPGIGETAASPSLSVVVGQLPSILPPSERLKKGNGAWAQPLKFISPGTFRTVEGNRANDLSTPELWLSLSESLKSQVRGNQVNANTIPKSFKAVAQAMHEPVDRKEDDLQFS